IKAGRWAGAEEVRRFRNEAEAVAKLDHPGIVPIYEVGEHRRRHNFSMKLIEGPSLHPPGVVAIWGGGEPRRRHNFGMKLIEGPSLADRLEDYAAEPRRAAH